MPVTSQSADKFALLFSGPTAPQFVKDLQRIHDLLVHHYNYPASQITVVVGEPTSASFPGSALISISSAAALAAAISTFRAAAAGAPHTALLYFTGGVHPTTRDLAIDGTTAPATVSPTWLRAELGGFGGAQVHVIMTQYFAGRYETFVMTSGLAEVSFTAACGAGEESLFDPVEGGLFTQGMAKGLRLEPVSGVFADTLGPGPEATDGLVSLREAHITGRMVQTDEASLLGLTPPTPVHTPLGATAMFLGLPSLLVRDGAPWWESPDITLAHPNHPTAPPGDLYIPDAVGAVAPFNNTVQVDVRNVGTHPVRRYSLAVEIFHSGMGPTIQQTALDVTPAAGTLRPIPTSAIATASDVLDTFAWNTALTEGVTHRCIKAEAKLRAADVDFAWDVVPRDFEAQRNIDPLTLAPESEQAGPEREIAGLAGLRGTKRHVYAIENRFRDKRRFSLVFPENLEKLTRGARLAFFARGEKGQIEGLEIQREPAPNVTFELAPRQKREIVVEVTMGREPLREELRIPFEIVADAGDKTGPLQSRLRLPAADILRVKWPRRAAVAGLTVVVRPGAATLHGRVVGPDGKPAAKARVIVRSASDLNGAVTRTDEKGIFRLVAIHPDVYHVTVEPGRKRPRVIQLLPGAEERVELEVD